MEGFTVKLRIGEQNVRIVKTKKKVYLLDGRKLENIVSKKEYI